MDSPITSKAISTLPDCSPPRACRASAGQPDMQGNPGNDQPAAQQQARHIVQPQCSYDVGPCRPRRSAAEPRVVCDPVGIDARAGQRQTERAGHRRLRPAGIRRTVLAGVAQHRDKAPHRPRVADEQRRRGKQEAAEPRRHEVQQIVEARGRPAECAITLRAMPDHAVERVRHLVGEEAGQTADQVPEDRRADAVAEILGEALDRGARDAVPVEAYRVAPDDMADRRAPGLEAAIAQRQRDGGDMQKQAALRHQNADQQRFDQRAHRPAAAQCLDEPADRGGAADQHKHGHNAALAADPLGALLPVQLALDGRDCPPGEHDRMRQKSEYARHVAEQRVDRQAGEQQQQRIVQGWRPHRGGNLGCSGAAINRARSIEGEFGR
jgi:hypothetical protein